MDVKKFQDECRKVVTEGCILLENDGTLPLTKEDKAALFGREQFEYVKSGSGSGGKVNCPYVTDLNSSLKSEIALDGEVEEYYKKFIQDNPYNCGDGWRVPPVQKQPYLDDDFVSAAAKRCNKAVIVISRVYGESFDVHNGKGGWRLTDEEERTIALATQYFLNVAVVVNSGNLIDFGWVKKYNVNAVMLIWQGGQEGASGAADLLVGKCSPCGKLPVTIADIENYKHVPFGATSRNIHSEDIYVGYRYLLTFCPDKIRYPFGYGKSYTEFVLSNQRCEACGDEIRVSVDVTNVGACAGKEVVQVYYSAPRGKLGKAAKELVAFCKTDLLQPNETCKINLSFKIDDMRSFDDTGATGFKHCFVMEGGDYEIYVGTDSVHCKKAFTYSLAETVCVERLSDALHPRQSFMRLTTNGYQKVCGYEGERAQISVKEIEYTGDKGYVLKDVANGVCDLDDFIAQFTAEELSYLVKGEGWGSPKTSIEGTASVFGGITEPFIKHGVPLIAACDGPSGVRTTESKNYTCIPSGVMLSSTWAPELLKNIFRGFTEEMKDSGIDVILAPGVNIHRHPFGGRNFEYFSEDPLLAGCFADAVARYFTDNGVYATVKHFAVNSQETGRDGEDEVVSERALREIYLKVFEKAVKGGGLRAIMTSYNRINGTSACANAELTDVILRREWGFNGFVMSDWWAKADKFSDGSFSANNLAEMIKAQNDIFMVVSDAANTHGDLPEELKNGNLTVGELQLAAKHVLRFIMSTQTFKTGNDTSVAKNAGDKNAIFVAVANNAFDAPETGEFLAEIVYSAGGTGLEQFSVPVRVNGAERLTITAKGTNASTEKISFKITLKKGDEVVFGTKIKVNNVSLIKG